MVDRDYHRAHGGPIGLPVAPAPEGPPCRSAMEHGRALVIFGYGGRRCQRLLLPPAEEAACPEQYGHCDALAMFNEAVDWAQRWTGAILTSQSFAKIAGHLLWGTLSARIGARTVLLLVMIFNTIAAIYS